MFFKYTVLTVLCSLALTVCVYEYHADLLKELKFRATVFSDTLVNTFVSLLETFGISRSVNRKKNNESEKPESDKLYTLDELRTYTGESGTEIYLSILGKVYDVGAGKKHYGPGGGYHFFAGKDASRSFVTGDFNSEDLTDDVKGLTPAEIKSILQWTDFYHREYKYKGKLVGRYYDANGRKTSYHVEIEHLIDEATRKEETENNEKLLFPPCNAEWSQEAGSRVWCTTMSGGIAREWVGVPRQLYVPGSETYRCACVKVDKLKNPSFNTARLKEYPDCNSKAVSCRVKT